MSVPKRVLYVEDDLDIQAIAKIALESVGGFDLMMCGDGHEALDKYIAFQPDLILLDMMMPGIDGITVLEQLRAQDEGREIPIIFMTAKVQPSEVSQYIEMGAIGVIAKPFNPMTLANEVIDLWRSADVS